MIDKGRLSELANSLLGIRLTSRQMESFAWYADELIEWNQRYNLTAITDPAEIEVKHFLDSLTCLKVNGGLEDGTAVDVGTGAGFPGIPLKIVKPTLRLTLVESIGKKIEFCRHVIRTLNLDGVKIVHKRAEQIGHQKLQRGAFERAFARAVAPLPVLVEYILPLLELGGMAIIQKGETGPSEAQAAEAALSVLGGRIERLVPVELPGVAERRYLVVVEKHAATPEKFPRRSGIPSKRPLL